MVTLQSYTETGKTCPCCGNNTVFDKDVYRYRLFYRYTITECELDDCSFRIMYDKEKGIPTSGNPPPMLKKWKGVNIDTTKNSLA